MLFVANHPFGLLDGLNPYKYCWYKIIGHLKAMETMFYVCSKLKTNSPNVNVFGKNPKKYFVELNNSCF